MSRSYRDQRNHRRKTGGTPKGLQEHKKRAKRRHPLRKQGAGDPGVTKITPLASVPTGSAIDR